MLPGEQEEVETGVQKITTSAAQYLEAGADLGGVCSTHARWSTDLRCGS